MNPFTTGVACVAATHLYNFTVNGSVESLMLSWAYGSLAFFTYQLENNYERF
jgi:hypothetical protein